VWTRQKMFGENHRRDQVSRWYFVIALLQPCSLRNENKIPIFYLPSIIMNHWRTGTVAVELWKNKSDIDTCFTVGGGGLCSGVGFYFKIYSPKTKIIGLEPEGAPSHVLKNWKPAGRWLWKIDSFKDGVPFKTGRGYHILLLKAYGLIASCAGRKVCFKLSEVI